MEIGDSQRAYDVEPVTDPVPRRDEWLDRDEAEVDVDPAELARA